MIIERLDHLVLTVRDIDRTIAFYERALHLEPIRFGDRRALRVANQKINLHVASGPFKPHAQFPTPGACDLCFVTLTPIEEVVAHLEHVGVVIVEGPVTRQGAVGPMQSVYFYDPDGNLVEVGVYRKDIMILRSPVNLR